MPSDYERVRDAIAYIEEHATDQPSLDVVAAHVGLSTSHLQRVFTRWAGVSPKRFLQALTVARARRLLRESAPVLDAAYGAGLSGAGRLHDLIVTVDAVTPGEYKSRGAGLDIRFGFADTPFGTALIAVTDRGVCALRFTDDEQVATADLSSDWRGARLVRDAAVASDTASRVFAASGAQEPLALLLKGTNFQLKVWEALLRVPEGSVVAYGQVAAKIGEPTASRAVANAVGANPIAYVIPCHRVLRASGALGGYRWGVERKRTMLARELVLTSDDVGRTS